MGGYTIRIKCQLETQADLNLARAIKNLSNLVEEVDDLLLHLDEVVEPLDFQRLKKTELHKLRLAAKKVTSQTKFRMKSSRLWALK